MPESETSLFTPLPDENMKPSIALTKRTIWNWTILCTAFVSIINCPCRNTEAQAVVLCDNGDTTPGCITKVVLDAWAQSRGDSSYESDAWDRTRSCLVEAGPPLQTDSFNLDFLQAHDAAWFGLIEYGRQGGQADGSDPVGSSGGIYAELDPQPLSPNPNPNIPNATDFIILEPCNSVSSLAYYRSAFALCEYPEWTISPSFVAGMVQSLALLTVGSTFYHSTQTRLGRLIDIDSIDLLFWNALQGALEPLGTDNPVLLDANTEPSALSATESTSLVGEIILTENLNQWQELISSTVPTPSFFLLSFAILNVGLNLTLGPVASTALSTIAASLILEQDQVNFLLGTFEPTLREAVQAIGIEPSQRSKTVLFRRLLGLGIKFFYAFVWQEELLPGPQVTGDWTPFWSQIGAFLMPKVNLLGNLLTGYPRLLQDPNVQITKQVYPGDAKCRREDSAAHAKWHEQSANALVDFLLVCDDIHKVLDGQELTPTYIGRTTTKIQDCLREHESMAHSDDDDDGGNEDIMMSLITDALEECIGYITGHWPQTNVGEFNTCLYKQLMFPQSYHEVLPKHTATKHDETLEGCLMEHDCIAFDGFGLDTTRLLQCIGFRPFTNSDTSCTKFRSMWMVPCIWSCWGDTLCLLSCFREYGELSPAMDRTLACLLVMGSPKAQGASNLLEVCMELSQAEEDDPMPSSIGMSSFFRALMEGLPQVVSTTLGSCASSYDDARLASEKAVSCTQRCLVASSPTLMPFPFLPSGMNCVFQCVLEEGLGDLR